ncbi:MULTISPECIES: NAD(P)H-dependent oxidoreductase [unclassified Pseudoalteromonas]|uniref:NAD(P)H-dependent oxidoreductase n=1 Tax=unclassified Pseudoalteromonas TaxID=194690 RepID=UPI003864C156
MKKILIINANPKSTSLCRSLAEQYALAAKNKHNVEKINISELNFKISLDEGYDRVTNLEADLVDLQNKIRWADHLVIVSPVWWGAMPAKFKGVIDRTFLPGFAFKYVKGKSIPEKLLKGRTSELIFTLDTPVFWYKYIQGNTIHKQLKHCILNFSGIKNTCSTYFAPVINSKSDNRQAWLNKVTKRAANLK